MRNKLDKEINKQELNEVISLSKKILKILYIVFIVCIVLASIIAIQTLGFDKFLVDLLKVVSPLFIGFIAAWLLRPIVILLNKKINNITLSSILVFGVFVLLVFVLIYSFVPSLYKEVNELVGLLPSFIERINKEITNIFNSLSNSGINLDEFKVKLLQHISEYGTEAARDLPANIINFIGTFISGLGTVGMGLVIGLYMLIDYDSIGSHFKKLFPINWQDDIHSLASKMSIEARKCVNGTFLVALMVLICDSIGFSLVGLNAPLLFGFFCGLTDLIPFIGPYIGGAAAVIVGLTQDPLIGIGVLIICVLVQLIENYVLQPLVMSKASSLHPIAIIIALIVFGHFFGMVGMILAMPVLTIMRVLFEFTVAKINEHKAI